MAKSKTYTVLRNYDVIGVASTHAEALALCKQFVLDNNVSARLVCTSKLAVPDWHGQVRKITHVLYAYRTLYFEQFLILPPNVGVADFVPPTQ